MNLSKMASKAGICPVLEPVIFTAFCYQFQSAGQFFNVIDAYVFLPSVGLLVFKLQLRKMCNSKIQGESVELVIFLWKLYLVFKFKV